MCGRLEAFADTLAALGLCEVDAAVPAVDPAALVGTTVPRPMPLSEILAGWDLTRVREACLTLYGPAGTHRVSSDGCVADARRMIEAFRAAGLEPLHGLRDEQAGGPMTPRRVLTALYADNARQRDAAPGDWTVLRDRVLARGGDRDVLIAMLAWAAPRGDKAHKFTAAIAQAWSLAPDEPGPGMPELTLTLDTIRPNSGLKGRGT